MGRGGWGGGHGELDGQRGLGPVAEQGGVGQAALLHGQVQDGGDVVRKMVPPAGPKGLLQHDGPVVCHKRLPLILHRTPACMMGAVRSGS